MLRIQDWKSVQEELDKQSSDDFIVEVGSLISNLVQRFPDVVFSRYYEADFALFLPHTNVGRDNPFWLRYDTTTNRSQRPRNVRGWVVCVGLDLTV